MSKLAELIREHCPEGVIFKSLNEIGAFYGGLSGKTKTDFLNGNAKFISYMNVFNNLSLNTEIDDKVRIQAGERQNTIQYGDILFTGSSETPQECGMSSVLTKSVDEKIYLNSFCFGFRLHDDTLLLPNFSKYLFRSDEIRKQIKRTANGVTRFNVSKKKMEKVTIPLPPLPVQHEIVRILDHFTELTIELTTELTTELTARKKQYEYYRDALLTFRDEVEWKTLGEIATEIYRGSGIKRNEITEDGHPCVRYGEIYTTYNLSFDRCVSHTFAGKKTFEHGDLLFAITGESVEEIAKSCVYMGYERCFAGGDIVVMKHNQNPKYLSYALSTSNAQSLKSKGKVKSKVVHSSIPALKKIQIPIPTLQEQARIVQILENFDTLCNDLSEGLPAEIDARNKQYEYYRDILLTFREKRS